MNKFLAREVGLTLALLSMLSGCGKPEQRTVQKASTPPDFEARLLEIAQTYEFYGRFEPDPRFAPQLCAFVAHYPNPRFSGSMDTATHGNKLYYLFAKHVKKDASSTSVSRWYAWQGEPNPVGQFVVKEAWVPEEVSKETKQEPIVVPPVRGGEEGDERVLPYATRNGRLYRASRKMGLFIMYKVDPSTPGTDEGWVYGTATADGKQVTSAGRVESCMKCHQKAPHDRLFGVPKDKGD